MDKELINAGYYSADELRQEIRDELDDPRISVRALVSILKMLEQIAEQNDEIIKILNHW